VEIVAVVAAEALALLEPLAGTGCTAGSLLSVRFWDVTRSGCGVGFQEWVME
jgi:hypothetical protein